MEEYEFSDGFILRTEFLSDKKVLKLYDPEGNLEQCVEVYYEEMGTIREV